MKAAINVNPNIKNHIEAVQRVCDKLSSIGFEVCIDRHYHHDFSGVTFLHPKELFESCDIIIAVGGDGSILHSASDAILYDKPLLGINSGRLGFLAGLELDQLDELDRLVGGDYQLDNRMLLEVVVRDQKTSRFLCLNDAVVSKGSISRVVYLNILVSEKQAAHYRADGVIFSTPTGSTAYSLSAGGPVIDPLLDCIALTPISPHNLVSQTMIFSPEKELILKIDPSNTNEVFLTVDGADHIPLSQNASVHIKAADKKLKLIRLISDEFYELFNDKILGRGRG